jgi:hypothetical protein
MSNIGGTLAVIDNETNKNTYADWYDHDKWDIKNLGVISRGSERYKSIDFTDIKQEWLKNITKKYIRIIAINGSIDKINQNLSSLKLFSLFIQEQFSGISSTDITRDLIEEYLFYLKKLI